MYIMHTTIKGILKDFLVDLSTTFPELVLSEELVQLREGGEGNAATLDALMLVIQAQSESILKEDAAMFDAPYLLLPGIDLSALWKTELSAANRAIIWKYLKLFLFCGNISPDVQAKLAEAFQNMEGMFKDGKHPLEDMLEGKIGSLAKEIAKETVMDEEHMKSVMSDPSKLMGMVNTVGEKITQKIASGQIKESELIEEATEMLNRMKGMSGLDQMFKQFAGKTNVAATQAKMNQNLKKAKLKERLKAKLDKKKGK